MLISGAVALGSLWQAYRARQRANEAALRAVDIDLRANEALRVAKQALALAEPLAAKMSERLDDEAARRAAEVEAPGIRDRWIGILSAKRADVVNVQRRDPFTVSLDVPDLAHRLAVNLLRERVIPGTGPILAVHDDPSGAKITVLMKQVRQH